jgi:hypothetical protein
VFSGWITRVLKRVLCYCACTIVLGIYLSQMKVCLMNTFALLVYTTMSGIVFFVIRDTYSTSRNVYNKICKYNISCLARVFCKITNFFLNRCTVISALPEIARMVGCFLFSPSLHGVTNQAKFTYSVYIFQYLGLFFFILRNIFDWYKSEFTYLNNFLSWRRFPTL